MADKSVKPYVPEESSLPELTFKAVLLGTVMACVLGAANAYLGLRAGMTVSATFPAAVVAMAALRLFRGSILEENIARTTASVGEALVAGAIFTIPAFLISGVWDTFRYWESTLIMLTGGLLGVLLIVILRRPLVVDADLPFPESVACTEIVRSGQKGETGAKYVFGTMGLSALVELFKNSRGIQILGENLSGVIQFGRSRIQLLQGSGAALGQPQNFAGNFVWSSPAASPALIGVGYIIGFRLSAIVFSGGVFGWWLLVPMAIFFNGGLQDLLQSNPNADWSTLTNAVWYSQVRPIAVGGMLVGAFHTLLGLRKPLMEGLKRAFRDFGAAAKVGRQNGSRLDKDLPFQWIILGVLAMVVPIAILYRYFSGAWSSAIVAAIIMLITAFLFSAVAGYLVGVMGGSNNPISGLTLSTLVLAALLMVGMGVSGPTGVMAVLGVAAVVCCTLGIAGDMLQDLKIGHLLGGTPWKMQLSEIIGVIAASFVLVFPMAALHAATEGGIGGPLLPAPQAGLMAIMAKGIVGGDMAWPLVIMGMMFSFALILLKAPSPTLIAVGIYLPFPTTMAVFAGGVIKWLFEARSRARALTAAQHTRGENNGILLASGLVAGEALTGVILAVLYLSGVELPTFGENAWLGLLLFPLLIGVLVVMPLRSVMRGTRD